MAGIPAVLMGVVGGLTEFGNRYQAHPIVGPPDLFAHFVHFFPWSYEDKGESVETVPRRTSFGNLETTFDLGFDVVWV